MALSQVVVLLAAVCIFGASSSSGCSQSDMAKCSMGASDGTVDQAMCELIPKTEQCFRDLLARCVDQPSMTMMLEQAIVSISASKLSCGSMGGHGHEGGSTTGGDGGAPKEGCDIKKVTSCFGEQPKDLKSKCKVYPAAMKCYNDFKTACPSIAKMVPEKIVDSMMKVKQDCKDNGIALGDDNGVGALSPTSAIFLAATALLAAFFRF